jgi:hypothetical protein
VLLDGRPAELPQPVRNRPGVEAGGRPPRRLVAVPVKGTMMGATERDCELIADPAAQGLALHDSQAMGVARLPPAHEAWLRSHELQMGTIAVAARLAQGKENGVIHQCGG